AEIAAGIRVAWRCRRTGVTGPASYLSHVQRYGGGRNVVAAGIAEVEFDGVHGAAGSRSGRVVQRADSVGDIFGQACRCRAPEEAAVAAIGRGDRMRGNGKRSCKRG